MSEDKDFQQRIQKIEGLVRKVESLADPAARSSALELFQLVMELYGAGLDRMMNIVYESGEPGRAIIDEFGRDDLVGSLLILYGLHPLDLEGRVMEALDRVRPFISSHGGNVELLSVADGAVRLRIESSGQGCGSSAQTLKSAVEEAIYSAAPDLTALVIEEASPPQFSSGFVQLSMAGQK